MWLIPKEAVIEYKLGRRGFAIYWERQKAKKDALDSLTNNSVSNSVAVFPPNDHDNKTQNIF